MTELLYAVTEEASVADLHELILSARAGDSQAAEAFCRAIAPIVLSAAQRYETNPTNRDDLTQDAHERIIRHVLGGEDYAFHNPKGYAYQITRNRAIDIGKYNARRQHSSDEELAHMAGSFDVEQEVLDNEAYERMKQMFHEANCPEIFAIPVRLFHVEGLTYAEISKVMGIKEGTVRSRIHRGLRILRAHYTNGNLQTASLSNDSGRAS